MGLNTATLVDAVASHAAVTGFFERVNQHEPKSAPKGLTCAIWVQDLTPVQSSGLAAASVRLTFGVRIYTSMLTEPMDAIDSSVMNAVDALMTDYIGNFTLGGIVRDVDVLGADGPGLRAEAGYQVQDGKAYRVVTIFLPLIINDVYPEAP